MDDLQTKKAQRDIHQHKKNKTIMSKEDIRSIKNMTNKGAKVLDKGIKAGLVTSSSVLKSGAQSNIPNNGETSQEGAVTDSIETNTKSTAFAVDKKMFGNYKGKENRAEKSKIKVKESKANFKATVSEGRKAVLKTKETATATKETASVAKASGAITQKQFQRIQRKADKEVTKQTAKVTKEVGKAGIKALVAMLKASFKLSEAAIALLGGGGVVLVVIVVICIVCMIFASPLGITFSNDNDDEYSLTNVCSTLDGEFDSSINKIKKENKFDELVLNNYGLDNGIACWSDIIAAYTIRYNMTYGEDVSYFDEERVEALRNVVNDVVTVSSYTYTETTTNYVDTNSNGVYDKDIDEFLGETIKTILKIDVDYMTLDEMTEHYQFNKEENTSLKELMGTPEYIDLFTNFSQSAGTGNIVGNGQFIYPANGTKTISAGYPNYKSGAYHGGVDFPVPTGTPILAAANGTVTTVKELNYSYGHYVMLNHGNGLVTLYAHNSQILVKSGQTVKQGEIIALSGSTGNSTGPHCHFEVRVKGNRVNPMNYLK